jgi:polyisoprenoid-binding protein YceI
MNQKFVFSASLAALMLAACGTTEQPAEQTTVAPEAKEWSFAVDPATSTVAWSGTMVGVKTHTGTLKLTEGNFTAKGGQVIGGSFTVDMKSFALTDTNYQADGSKQGTRAMLMGHLMSPDFFAVDSFPTAQFTITGIEGNTAKGDLTVRGTTKPATVTGITFSGDSSHAMASGDLVFNRQDFGVSWASPMKDMVLSNDIALRVELHGSPK